MHDTLANMRVLLTGHQGQLGSALVPLLEALGEVLAVDQRQLDIVDRAAVLEMAHGFQPKVIVNAAAYTAVDQAQTDVAKAMAVNAVGPANLAAAASLVGASLVHFSTDFVFDGRLGRPYRPGDVANPINVYGRSKRAGEEAVIAGGTPGLIIRTSWLYGPSGRNFVNTMLRLHREAHGPVRVVADQTGCPTSTLVLASWTTAIIKSLESRPAPQPAEIVHLACEGSTTWHGFASEIFRRAGVHQAVQAITTQQFNAPAARPPDSRLDSSDSLARFALQPVDWRDGLDEVLARIKVDANHSVESNAASK